MGELRVSLDCDCNCHEKDETPCFDCECEE